MTHAGPALLDSLREAARSLYRARLRTVLGLIGIAIGIASVIAMVSAGEIAKAEARKQFEALGTDIVTVQVASGYQGAGIRLDEALALAESLPEISTAAPTVPGGARHGRGALRLETPGARREGGFLCPRYENGIGAERARAVLYG